MGLSAGTTGGRSQEGNCQSYWGSGAVSERLPAAAQKANVSAIAGFRNITVSLHPNDGQLLEHSNRARTAGVLWCDDSKWSLICEERLSIDGISDDDGAAREIRIQLGQ